MRTLNHPLLVAEIPGAQLPPALSDIAITLARLQDLGLGLVHGHVLCHDPLVAKKHHQDHQGPQKGTWLAKSMPLSVITLPSFTNL
jgi:hypothetical protein